MIKMKIRRSDFLRLEMTFEEIVKQVHRRAMKRALLKAATPMLKAARQNVPKRHGSLRKALKKRGRTYKDGRAFVIVGPDRNYQVTIDGKNVQPVYYAHLLEFGHVIKAKRKGRVLGHVPPKPFLRTAFESTKEKAKRIYKNEIGKALQAESRKAKRKMNK